MNRKFPLISLDYIIELESELLKLSKLTEYHIQDIWISSNETKLDNFNDLIYSWDAPLYQKMIFRFRNCEKNPSMFYNQLDPVNKNHLINFICASSVEQVIDFFIWLRSNYNEYILEMMKMDEYLINFWKDNELNFFFEINRKWQNKFVNTYNEYIRRFNDESV